MKKFLSVFLITTFLFSCGGSQKETTSAEKSTVDSTDVISYANVKDKSFDELFKKIEPTELSENIFNLVGKDYSVITAGTDSIYNSMTASYGGWGQLFDAPVTWCFLYASRYTLEFIKKEKSYTMTYFPDQFKDQVIAFGSKSGRNSDKMKQTTLTRVKTPSGNITYKEAKLIIECKLLEITETNPKDFYSEKGKEFVEKGKKDGNGKEYHKLVFGDITAVWIRK
ncbi:flavin reductase [Prevotella sp. 10(H)]|uniref:flavin reductase n=1 Tax=Prevotella sp. 10(H) TaxID=1158294 RepID=UPI00068A3530|nr:flavin reductase [Prevotella sp. 10(H)]